VTLRRRLSIWYGALLAVVLAVALTLAYIVHVESHDHDIDVAIVDLNERATVEVVAELRGGTAPSDVRLAELYRMIEEPHAVWLLIGTRLVDSVGPVDDTAFSEAGVTQLETGWHTSWTVNGRVRSFVAPVADTDLRVAIAVTLSEVDASNAELRTALLLLALVAVGVGSAGASTIAGSALRPVARMTETAAAIARSRDFSRRVRIAGDEQDELVQLGATFDEMLASLDSAHRQQQRFCGDVSHELRTPLTTIRGNAELLAAGETEPSEQREAIAQIRRESERLSRLVDELLVLARADVEESFAPRNVQLDEVLMEAFAELRGIAGSRLRLRSIDPVQVRAERDRLKQLILVLVDNALRYAPHGTVEISLADDGSDAVLRIEDDGIGVTPADMPRVFDRFYRGEAARRVNPSGSGLGLPIAKWIVERHGGTITLWTRDGPGTRVTVRIPIARPGGPDGVRTSESTRRPEAVGTAEG